MWTSLEEGDLLLGDTSASPGCFEWRDFVVLRRFRDYDIAADPGVGGVKLIDLHRGKVHEVVVHDGETIHGHTVVKRRVE
jgi:hypothetical protein